MPRSHVLASLLTLLAGSLAPAAAQEPAGSWERVPDVPRAVVTAPDGARYERGTILVGLRHPLEIGSVLARADERGDRLVGEIPALFLLKLELPPGNDERAAAADYATLPGVAFAELDHVGAGGGGGSVPPADTFYASNQWHHHNTGQVGGVVGADIDSQLAWGIEQGDPGVVLAVLDTGIDFTHPEFAGRTLPGFDFVNEDADPTADHPHGIEVSGLAAANANNAFGTAGVDWGCTILPVKVLNQSNLGTTFDLAQGLNYCAAQGADVVNMSLINYPLGGTLASALTVASNAGCILLACAGNGGIGDADVSGPGVSPLTISIGATNSSDFRASFSGTGNALDFVAPGELVATTSTSLSNTFALFSGCSAATPVASGVVALLKARYPTLDQACAYSLLQAGAEDQVGPPSEDTPGKDLFFGHGRINAGLSLGAQLACSSVHALVAAPGFVDLTLGSTQTLELFGGSSSAGDLYWVLGSATGTAPGIPLPPYVLPLNPDGYTQVTANLANSVVFPNTLGVLDGAGEATAGFFLPAGTDPGLAGVVLNHAYFLLDLGTFDVGGTSNPAPVTLTVPVVLLAEDFESGAPSWTFENTIGGLWHVASDGECGAVTQMGAYNNGPSSCDYVNGLLNLGGLVSPPFAITGGPPYTVEFDSLRQLDATGLDSTRVVLADVGSSQSVLLADGSLFDDTGQLESISLTVPNPGLWTGKTAELSFVFSGAVGGNDTLGWLVDDVRVTADGP